MYDKMSSQLLYLQINKNTETDKRNITLGDVATLFCTDKNILAKAKTIKILTVPKSDKKRICVSAMKVIELVSREFPDVEINNIGETDFIVDYICEENKWNKFINNKIVQKFLVGFVALFVFVGSVYAIMAYNNDVDTQGIFENIYELAGDEKVSDMKVLEISYAVGLAGGIIIFYNHFGGKRFGTDPTPIEVEMVKYEKDVDDALIERSAAANKERTVQ